MYAPTAKETLEPLYIPSKTLSQHSSPTVSFFSLDYSQGPRPRIGRLTIVYEEWDCQGLPAAVGERLSFSPPPLYGDLAMHCDMEFSREWVLTSKLPGEVSRLMFQIDPSVFGISRGGAFYGCCACGTDTYIVLERMMAMLIATHDADDLWRKRGFDGLSLQKPLG